MAVTDELKNTNDRPVTLGTDDWTNQVPKGMGANLTNWKDLEIKEETNPSQLGVFGAKCDELIIWRDLIFQIKKEFDQALTDFSKSKLQQDENAFNTKKKEILTSLEQFIAKEPKGLSEKCRMDQITKNGMQLVQSYTFSDENKIDLECKQKFSQPAFNITKNILAEIKQIKKTNQT